MLGARAVTHEISRNAQQAAAGTLASNITEVTDGAAQFQLRDCRSRNGGP
jgi:hypothetical protein